MKVYEAKVQETYRHKKTGELFKERKDWEAKFNVNRAGDQYNELLKIEKDYNHLVH